MNLDQALAILKTSRDAAINGKNRIGAVSALGNAYRMVAFERVKAEDPGDKTTAETLEKIYEAYQLIFDETSECHREFESIFSSGNKLNEKSNKPNEKPPRKKKILTLERLTPIIKIHNGYFEDRRSYLEIGFSLMRTGDATYPLPGQTLHQNYNVIS